jgi:hypothetical protein
MPLINAYQCMLLIWIHDAYCTEHQLLMYATYVIDLRVVLRSVLSIDDASYDWYRVLYHNTRYVCYCPCSRSTMHSIHLPWHHSIIDTLRLFSLSMCVFLSAVRMGILSIDSVWNICYQSCIHVINWWCILRMLLVITSMNDACSSCYQSMDICSTCDRSIMHSTNAIMRYRITWEPTMSFSLNTLWQPECVTWSV